MLRFVVFLTVVLTQIADKLRRFGSWAEGRSLTFYGEPYKFKKAIGWGWHAASVGAINLSALISSLVLIFVGFMFILKFTPVLETGAATTNITDTTTLGFVQMVPWIAPVLGLIALILGAVALISVGRSGRRGRR